MATTKLIGLSAGALAKKVSGLDFQLDLFRMAKLSPVLAETNKFVLSASTRERIAAGEDVDLGTLGSYTLTKRDNPITIFERDGVLESVAALSSASPSAKTFGKDFTTRSRDENRIFTSGNEVCSVEWKELH